MLSLPPLFPHDPHTLWYPTLSTHSHPNSHHQNQSTDPPSPTHPQNPLTNHPHHHQNAPAPRITSSLRTLQTDETALRARKANIRRFGAGWLRPPGVGKTLQGLQDERAEREEVEAQRAREFAAEVGQMEGMEGIEGLEGGEGVGEGVMGVVERDLDAEVPDADADEEEGGEEGGEGWVSEEDMEQEVPLEEEGMERDLDADLEEGEEGSYEHTDTEVEDSDSEDGGVGAAVVRGPRLATFNTRTGEVVRTPGGR